MNNILCIFLYFFLNLNFQIHGQGKTEYNFSTSSNEVAAWDIFEVTLTSENEFRGNPFTEASISGDFTSPTQEKIKIAGYCDAEDGKIFKLRFMPAETGVYSFTINFQNGKKRERFSGQFTSIQGNNKGMVQVDQQYPWHFIWTGSGEHYFYFGTTAYWLMGWKDEKIIFNAIDRLANYKVNRIRVAINGRQDHGNRWSEPLVQESEDFTFKLGPWIAVRPDDLDQPEFDVTRFNVAHWQKLDRLIAHAKSKGIVISLIFYVDGLDHGADPFKKANMGNADEKRYYSYAAARYSAHANIMWDVTNEYHLFRNEAWAEQMGNYLQSQDPYQHAQSIHGHGDFPFRKSPWVDFTMFQNWDECSNYEQMIKYREAQESTGTIKPQVNEEYGYESHYPPWGCGTEKVPPGRAAETRADLAWQMYMAGCYQTTGERADEGTGAGRDEGGGWINGRGNDRMKMFELYDVIYNTFTSLEWWKMNPSPELINGKNLCLAEPGKQYLIYTQEPDIKLTLEPGKYKVFLISPRTGENRELGVIEETQWSYPSKIGVYGKDIKENEENKVNFAKLHEKWAIKIIRINNGNK